MSSPPLSGPGNRAGLFFQAAGSFVSGLALALGSELLIWGEISFDGLRRHVLTQALFG